MKLRWPTQNEAILGAACLGLLALALRRDPGASTGPSRAFPVDTVTDSRIVKQEPPAKPGLLHRAAYRDVKPTHVQVAPGAGAELLASVCDTSAGRPASDSSRGPQADTAKTASGPAPSVPYAWKLHDGWTPWSAKHLQLDEVGRDGLRLVDVSVHAPAEGRFLPVEVTREARGWRRVLKPLPFVLGVAAIGYAAGKFGP